jgi:hypothetical protein
VPVAAQDQRVGREAGASLDAPLNVAVPERPGLSVLIGIVLDENLAIYAAAQLFGIRGGALALASVAVLAGLTCLVFAARSETNRPPEIGPLGGLL